MTWMLGLIVLFWILFLGAVISDRPTGRYTLCWGCGRKGRTERCRECQDEHDSVEKARLYVRDRESRRRR